MTTTPIIKACGACADMASDDTLVNYACQVAVCVACGHRHRLGHFSACRLCGAALKCEARGHRVNKEQAIVDGNLARRHVTPNLTHCPRCNESGVNAHALAAHFRLVKCQRETARRRYAKLGARDVRRGVADVLERAGYSRGASDNCEVIDSLAIGKNGTPSWRAIGAAIPAALLCEKLDASHYHGRGESDPVAAEAVGAIVTFLRDHMRPRSAAGLAAEAILDICGTRTYASEGEEPHAATLWTIVRETVGCSRCKDAASAASPGEIPSAAPAADDEEV